MVVATEPGLTGPKAKSLPAAYDVGIGPSVNASIFCDHHDSDHTPSLPRSYPSLEAVPSGSQIMLF